MVNVLKKLNMVQDELEAPKNQFNSFGKYHYRSCEDILEGLQPLLAKHGAVVVLSDEIKEVGGRVYVEATATFYDCESGEEISNTASAREAESKKGMDDSQVTGATSSYARKYALNGLFAIDDEKDADTRDNSQSGQKPQQKQYSDDNRPWLPNTQVVYDYAMNNGVTGAEAYQWADNEYRMKKEYRSELKQAAGL